MNFPEVVTVTDDITRTIAYFEENVKLLNKKCKKSETAIFKNKETGHQYFLKNAV